MTPTPIDRDTELRERDDIMDDAFFELPTSAAATLIVATALSHTPLHGYSKDASYITKRLIELIESRSRQDQRALLERLRDKYLRFGTVPVAVIWDELSRLTGGE